MPESDTYPWIAPVLAGALLVLLSSGCDAFEADGEEDIPALSSAWRVTDVVVDSVSIERRVDAAYQSLILTLREDGVGRNFFELFGAIEGTARDRLREGQFLVRSDEDELVLRPDEFRLLNFDYTIADQRQLTLNVDDEDAEDALRFLGLPLRGDIDELMIVLTEGQSPTGSPADG